MLTRLRAEIGIRLRHPLRVFGVGGLIRLGIHLGAFVYFALKLVIITPPVWLDVVVHVLNIAAVLRTVRILKPRGFRKPA